MSHWLKTIRRIGLLVACLLPGIVAGLAPAPSCAQTAPVAESKVKAALVVNFVAFMDWPDSAFADASSPIVVAVFGKDSIGRDLEQALERKTAKGRRVTFRRVLADSDLRGCHVLFFPAPERKRVRDVIVLRRPSMSRDVFLRIGHADRRAPYSICLS